MWNLTTATAVSALAAGSCPAQGGAAAWPHAGIPATANRMVRRTALAGIRTTTGIFAVAPLAAAAMTAGPRVHIFIAGPRLPLTPAPVSPRPARTARSSAAPALALASSALVPGLALALALALAPAPALALALGRDAVPLAPDPDPGLAVLSGVGTEAVDAAAGLPAAARQPSFTATAEGRAPAAIVTPVVSSLTGDMSIT